MSIRDNNFRLNIKGEGKEFMGRHWVVDAYYLSTI